MPPKKKPNEPSKKTEAKKKEKVIEDKTFGLKNKKGTKQQKFIKTVTHQVQHGGQKVKQSELDKPGEKKSKKDELDELNKLFRPVQQTVSKGVDPKSVVCAFFKQGQCTKGDRCKFSHDLNVGRKGEKKNLYEDVRDDDNMADWDEEKLEEVVNKKHSEADKAKPKTSIICKHFLDAVENSKYGWFWECPNGGNKCMYKHALPAGFVLKKDQKKVEKEEQISIEELIEKERASLGASTRVTLESFLKWKDRKRKEKVKSQVANQDKKKCDFKMGKMLGISGRELFEFDPDLVAGDDDEATDEPIEREDLDDDDYEGVTDTYTDLTSLGIVPTDVDGSGTIAHLDRLAAKQASGEPPTVNGVDHTAEATKLYEAAALPPTGARGDTTERDAAIAAAMNGDMNIDNMAIDEDLFDEEGLDMLEDDLDELDMDN